MPWFLSFQVEVNFPIERTFRRRAPAEACGYLMKILTSTMANPGT
jgi:hypothetical protein